MWIFSASLVPRTAAGSAPPEANAAARTPPSHGEVLPPLSGQLLAPPPPWKSVPGDAQYSGPPLSAEKTSSVFSHMPGRARMAAVTFPRISSHTEHSAAYSRRSRAQLGG